VRVQRHIANSPSKDQGRFSSEGVKAEVRRNGYVIQILL
jgi:hypothetical protein